MFSELLARIAGALDVAKIRYMVIGGQAVILYEDVQRVLLKKPAIDHRYVEEWLEKFADALGEPLLQRFRDAAAG